MSLRNKEIKYCKIFPGIGIARLGNSPGEFFIGPESPGCHEIPPGGFKDCLGRIKRQAARFRIYAFDQNKQVIGELTVDEGADVTWTVELANTKAAWHTFRGVKAGLNTDNKENPTPLRNQRVHGSDRKELEIRPAPRSIGGRSVGGSAFRFDDGVFRGIPVPLGELKTDDNGRLLVLGGHGYSDRTPDGEPISDYANNDFWFDDTSDGPVKATVRICGRGISVIPAWVIVAPPKFSPFTENIVTLFDVIAAASSPPENKTKKLYFCKDIYPFFQRLSGYQWVSALALRGHGPSKPGNFLSAELVTQLRDKSEKNSAFRQSVLSRVRDPYAKDSRQANYRYMPQLSGDEGDAAEDKPYTWLYVLESQYDVLKRWAKGDFEDDWKGSAAPPREWRDIMDPQEQIESLNRAALEACVGGAFYPGFETTYVVRCRELYEEPFRLKAASLEPGDMTKRLACPWQADFYECKTNWWPAQRPDYVLNEQELEEIARTFVSEESHDLLATASLKRLDWARGVGQRLRFPVSRNSDPVQADKPQPGDNDMVTKWSTLGFLVPHTTRHGELFLVETDRSRYDGLSDREYFYIMQNLDAFSDFRPRAKALADEFLDSAWQASITPADRGGVDDIYRFFPYSPEAFSQRMDENYDFYREDAAAAQAYFQKLISTGRNSGPNDDGGEPNTREEMIERVRQFAPLNQLDGVWLRNIGQLVPFDEITSLLFSIWRDEVGNGDPKENHSNVYTKLLESIGIDLPPVNSREYAQDARFLDSSFTVPVLELVVSEFTNTFFPEILGMTLEIEWEVLQLWRTIYRLAFWGIDPFFYTLHVGIDNAASGHGARARRAVELYIDQVRRRTGSEEEVQRQWKRIWRGYVAFATTGSLSEDIGSLFKEMRAQTPKTRLINVIEQKKAYAHYNHGEKMLGNNLINDWFEDPDGMLTALQTEGLVVPGSVENSKFLERLTFSGPMYQVFTEDEIQLWKEWILWLPTQGPKDAADLRLLDRPSFERESSVVSQTVRSEGVKTRRVGPAFHLDLYSTQEQKARHPRGTVLGMGAVH